MSGVTKSCIAMLNHADKKKSKKKYSYLFSNKWTNGNKKRSVDSSKVEIPEMEYFHQKFVFQMFATHS